MEQNIKWGLILVGVLIVAGLAIWGVRSLWKGNEEKNEKLSKKDLDDLVNNAANNAINEFIEAKTTEAKKDETIMTEAKNGVKTASITAGDITTSQEELAKKDKKNKDAIDKVIPANAASKAEGNVTTAIEKEATKIIDDLLKKKIKEAIESESKKAAISATTSEVDKLVKKSVKKGSSDDTSAAITKKAKEAATEKANTIISPEKLGTIQGEVKSEANKALKPKWNEIKKAVIEQAIKTEAKIA